MRKHTKSVILALLFLVMGNYSYSQSIPFDSDRWEVNAKESNVETYLGKKSLFLQKGFAVVKDSEFTDGIIEYDVAFSKKRGFMGAVWRLQDLENHEHFYIRSHQSGNPDATQYTPIFNGSSGWQIYYGEGYAASVKHSFNEWVHVKIIVSGKNAEVYIQDMDTPLLFIHDLKREIKSGKVGIVGGVGAPGHFANFSYTTIKNPPLKGKAKTLEPPTGAIMSWSVSNAFDEKSLKGKYRLTKDDKQKLTWEMLTSDRSGLANLARVQGPKKGKNSAFTRITITSEIEQIKLLQFGFSDRAKVYFNNQLVYAGDNTYRTRDYRFLGTIGFFDELYLPLKKGENELWIAVSETFGGWGVQAKFEDMVGISVK
jgi:hypothetical protein